MTKEDLAVHDGPIYALRAFAKPEPAVVSGGISDGRCKIQFSDGTTHNALLTEVFATEADLLQAFRLSMGIWRKRATANFRINADEVRAHLKARSGDTNDVGDSNER